MSRRRIARILSGIALGLSVLILGVSALGYAAYRYYNGKLNTITIHGAGPSVGVDHAQDFLLVGSDTRNFKGGSAFQANPGSPNYVVGQRSDTVILVHIPAGQAKATVVSFPRDSFVRIPSYVDANGVNHPAHMGKLNEAFSDGGAPLLVKMLEQMSGLHIDHYVQINFAGFESMVNALGGVSLCIGTTRHDKDSGDYLTAGFHPNVNGAQALSFVRDRKGLPLGDIDRIKDQQYFLSQLMKKVLSAGTLSNPFTLNAFLTALTSNVTVDSGFGFTEIRTLATRMRHLDPAHVTFKTLPFTNPAGVRTFEGATQSVVLLDPVADAQLFAELRSDTPSGASPSAVPAPTATPLTVPPSQIPVMVFNATTITGLAARTSQQLAAVGFKVAGVGSLAARPGTTVVYGPDRVHSARTLAAAVPGSTLQENPALSGVVQLVLGNGPVTVQPVSVGTPGPAGGATAPPATTASPAPPPVTAASASCAP